MCSEITALAYLFSFFWELSSFPHIHTYIKMYVLTILLSSEIILVFNVSNFLVTEKKKEVLFFTCSKWFSIKKMYDTFYLSDLILICKMPKKVLVTYQFYTQ